MIFLSQFSKWNLLSDSANGSSVLMEKAEALFLKDYDEVHIPKFSLILCNLHQTMTKGNLVNHNHVFTELKQN